MLERKIDLFDFMFGSDTVVGENEEQEIANADIDNMNDRVDEEADEALIAL